MGLSANGPVVKKLTLLRYDWLNQIWRDSIITLLYYVGPSSYCMWLKSGIIVRCTLRLEKMAKVENQIFNRKRPTIPASEVGVTLIIPDRVIEEIREENIKQAAAMAKDPKWLWR